jgi:hypothetical protein
MLVHSLLRLEVKKRVNKGKDSVIIADIWNIFL